MRGIIYAGGTGSQFDLPHQSGPKPAGDHPAGDHLAAGTQPLPHLPMVHDKPLVYYALSTLMLAGIRDILLVAPPEHIDLYLDALDDGRRWGLNLQYAEETQPRGIAQALVIGRDFLAGEPVALIRGDNLFFGSGMLDCLMQATHLAEGARVLAYRVYDPKRIEVIELYKDGRPHSVAKRPTRLVSEWAVTGLYFFDGRASEIAGTLSPSGWGEVEIADLIAWYLNREKLSAERLEPGFAWFNARSADQMAEAAQFVESLETQFDLKIACLEEIALGQGFIDLAQFDRLAELAPVSGYGIYLKSLAAELTAKGSSTFQRIEEYIAFFHAKLSKEEQASARALGLRRTIIERHRMLRLGEEKPALGHRAEGIGEHGEGDQQRAGSA